MENIKLSLSTINLILNYLGTRPYAEVFQLINQIQKEAQMEVQNGGKVDSEGNQ